MWRASRDGLTRPFLLTGELCAFDTPVPSARIIFPYDLVGGKALLMSAERIERDFPRGWAYLCERREELCKRERGKWPADRWYAFGRSQNLTQMEAAKLIIQVTARRPTVLLDETGLSMTGGGSGPFYGIRPKDAAFPMKYLLALLNSSLFGAMVRAQSTNLRGGYIKYSKQYIETAPVIRPAAAGPENVAGLIARVDELIALRRQLAAPGAPHEIENRRNQLAALTAALDALVGQVYGLTPEESAAFEAF